MGLLLDDPAEDVISGAAKPSDLCRYSYRITKWLNAGGGKERDEAMFLINSLRCCGRKQPLLLTFTFFQTHVCRGHKRPRADDFSGFWLRAFGRAFHTRRSHASTLRSAESVSSSFDTYGSDISSFSTYRPRTKEIAAYK
ncbi:hypothetical protein F2P81_005348 [Scophthalmus maximus]|uniref:Uncharacterized protein n=1 Tax=Scophthalmus maximus TaxID=52904 RepID=A0A6A4T2W3_SCOMX|nr:hypothetical protein F2P81_005348 [Scophthalmus maximus]